MASSNVPLEQIEQMEKQRSQAIESLDITDHSVKCQKCGIAVPIVGKSTRTKNDRIAPTLVLVLPGSLS